MSDNEDSTDVMEETEVEPEAGEEEAMEEGKEEEEEKEEGEEEEKVEEEEEEKLPDVPLTHEMVKECLTQLCKIGDGLAHAYVKMDCKERELTDITLMGQYIHIRYIDISTNNLKNIDSISSMTHMLSLKADQNLLPSAALEELPYLQIASFSHNKIKNTEGINHPMLEQLNLSFNEITEVCGFDPLKLSRLHSLELRGNKLTHTGGIELPNLRNLFVAQNAITEIKGLNCLTNLTTLHLRDNQLANLDGFTDDLKNLQYINMRGNQIASLKEVEKLQPLPNLRALALAENPVCEEDDYRMECLIALRKLERLDKDEYTDEERQEAEAIFEQRRQEKLAREGTEEVIEDEDPEE